MPAKRSDRLLASFFARPAVPASAAARRSLSWDAYWQSPRSVTQSAAKLRGSLTQAEMNRLATMALVTMLPPSRGLAP